MATTSKEEGIKYLEKAQEIKSGIERMVHSEKCDGSAAFKAQLKKTCLRIVQNLERGIAHKEKENILSALNEAKKAAQKTRTLVYDGVENHSISKEDFDFFYNELAHLSSNIGKLKIHLQFPSNFQ